jgi:hypothetical protein
MIRKVGHALVAVAAAAALASCGGGSNSQPISPGPITQPVTPPNTPPVIESIVASASRTEVEADVTLTATVRDAETAVSLLRFEWKADVGTITGEGPSVKWRAAKGATTPSDQTIRLTVTETYGAGLQNVVNGTSPAIRLHDSQKELGELSLGFLGDFANSSVSPSACVREFSDSCRGKAAEKGDIESNREHFVIMGSALRLKSVAVHESGLRANMTVGCSFTSRIIKCEPGSSGCVVGSVGTVAGDCLLTGVYEQGRWWLCDSNFNGAVVPGFQSFFSRRGE